MSVAPATCFHCGLPLADADPRRADVLGAPRDFCCAGCEAVARAIVAAGFGRYYETRSATGAGPLPQDLPPAAIYDDPLAQKAFVASTGPHRREATLALERIRCAACAWLSERTLRALPGVLRADVNFATRRAQVAWDERRTALSCILETLRAVGYDATPFDPRRRPAIDEAERRSALGRLFVAGLGAMQVMMYAVPAYLDEGGTLQADAAQLMRWASLLLTLPVVLYSCAPFFAAAWQDLRRRRLSLDTPIALGILAGFAASVRATFAGVGEVYFDSIAMLAFLLLAARYAELAARGRAARELDRLRLWAPDFASRLAGGAAEKVPAHALAPGDLVLVAAGERFPADGAVVSGASSADESLLTGEAKPVPKTVGAPVIAGAINLEQAVTVRVTRAGAETQAAAIARLVERAAAGRPRLIESADRVARALTWFVLAAALAGFWHTGELRTAVAVLVITCPCALALASPVALTLAAARLLERGAVLVRPRALEALERATDVVLDKTGTLTTGEFRLVDTTMLGPVDAFACRALAARLEAGHRHPIALAFQAGNEIPSETAENHPGSGVEGSIEGIRFRIGTAPFCAELAGSPCPCAEPEAFHSPVYLAQKGRWLAQFFLADTVRTDAAAAVRALEESGLRVHLLSGDEPAIVAELAHRLGIGSFEGGASPQAKFAFVERLQAAGRRVVMVGDGLNDAPVLARADVSFAMSGAAGAAQARSDVLLTARSLQAVPDTLRLARRAMRVVRENFAWALAYNALALPLAASGLLGPWEAALGMAASSFIVLLNASRLAGADASWKASTSSFRSRSLSYS